MTTDWAVAAANPHYFIINNKNNLFSVKIGVFYLVYYAFLAGFFMLMLLAFFQTLHDDKPAWDSSNGIIGDNPGKIPFGKYSLTTQLLKD